MKKLGQIICISFSIFFLMSVVVFAYRSESGELLESSENSVNNRFYVQSLSCPADIVEYASENAISLIATMDEAHSLDHDTIKVGQPFTYGDSVSLFTFPVYSGDKIVYTLRVTYAPDGSVNGTASTFLVDELNVYRNRTSQDRPLLLSVIDNSLYACLNNETTKICAFPEWDSIEAEYSSRGVQELETLDISEPIELQYT